MPAARHDGGELSVTISIGVATATSSDETADDLLQRADEALYRAKNAGRNRVEAADGTDYDETPNENAAVGGRW
jgi:diguanylate cyclase (GGDEF)-like protein